MIDLRALWIRIRLHVWGIFCELDDACGIPRIGSRRAKDD
jgi:hypothetical protein